MIVDMRKVYVVARKDDRQALLDALENVGMLHIAPVEPSRAVAEEKIVAAMDRLRRAIQVLANVAPSGDTPDLPVSNAADEILHIQRHDAELQNQLTSLHRRHEQQAVWGDLRIEQIEKLRQADVNIEFYMVPAADVDEVSAECVHTLGELPGKDVLVAVIGRDGEVRLPPHARKMPLPQQDRPTMRAEAERVEKELRKGQRRLGELAGLQNRMEAELRRLHHRAEYSIAARSALEGEELVAMQGWVPADDAPALAEKLRDAGVDVAVQAVEPEEDELPPTLIRYPKWARPIKGLFDILGTFPGYREYDLSPFFMVALPLFAAMLIGDAGYGLVFVLISLLGYGPLVRKAGKAQTQLILTVGICTLVWGVLTANYFGITPNEIMAAGGFASVAQMESASGFYATVGRWMATLGVLFRQDSEAARFLIIKISFIIGCIHLVSAHFRQAVGFWPHQKAYSEIGWCLVLTGMLGVVWKLFNFAMPQWVLPAAIGSVAAGYLLAVLFGYPVKNLLKRIGLGFAASLLPLINAFGDTMSYIRLMAVGLATYYIASAFNGLGAMVAEPTPILWSVGAPVILFGHALNIGLAIIAIFAHGVRLNMLEFSNNAGVQWAGYAYQPFGKHQAKE